jgi:hypothetical protein
MHIPHYRAWVTAAMLADFRAGATAGRTRTGSTDRQ